MPEELFGAIPDGIKNRVLFLKKGGMNESDGEKNGKTNRRGHLSCRLGPRRKGPVGLSSSCRIGSGWPSSSSTENKGKGGKVNVSSTVSTRLLPTDPFSLPLRVLDQEWRRTFPTPRSLSLVVGSGPPLDVGCVLSVDGV